MVLLIVALVLVWPVVELVALLAVADAVGLFPALVLLVASSVLGAYLLKRTGLAVWRRATEAVAAGRPPTRELLDGPMVLLGGVALMVPGFVSAVLGALLLLPPVRALVRPLLALWVSSRAGRAARGGRLSGVVIDTVVGADGRVHQRSRTFGDVIDSEGWEVADDPRPLGPGSRGVDALLSDDGLPHDGPGRGR